MVKIIYIMVILMDKMIFIIYRSIRIKIEVSLYREDLIDHKFLQTIQFLDHLIYISAK